MSFKFCKFEIGTMATKTLFYKYLKDDWLLGSKSEDVTDFAQPNTMLSGGVFLCVK